MFCTHPNDWPCSHDEHCNSQKVRDAQLMLSQGHARLTDVPGVGDDDESLKVGFTGRGEPAIGRLSESELADWDELDRSGEYTLPTTRHDDDEDGS